MYDLPVNRERPQSPQPPFAPFVQVAPRHELKHEGYFAWRPNGTDDWLIKYTISGFGRFAHHAGEIIVQAGDMVLVKPGTMHDYGIAPNTDAWELIWAHFRPRPEWLEWLVWPEESPGLMRLSITDLTVRKRIERELFNVNSLARGKSPRREAFAMNALEKALLLCDAQNPLVLPRTLDDERVNTVKDHLRQHMSEQFQSETIVQVSGLSRSRLYHLFAQQVGESPLEFLEFLRIDKAKQLLEVTAKSVQGIALEVGFEDPLYFSRRFRLRVGLSPRQYRTTVTARQPGTGLELM